MKDLPLVKDLPIAKDLPFVMDLPLAKISCHTKLSRIGGEGNA